MTERASNCGFRGIGEFVSVAIGQIEPVEGHEIMRRDSRCVHVGTGGGKSHGQSVKEATTVGGPHFGD